MQTATSLRSTRARRCLPSQARLSASPLHTWSSLFHRNDIFHRAILTAKHYGLMKEETIKSAKCYSLNEEMSARSCVLRTRSCWQSFSTSSTHLGTKAQAPLKHVGDDLVVAWPGAGQAHQVEHCCRRHHRVLPEVGINQGVKIGKSKDHLCVSYSGVWFRGTCLLAIASARRRSRTT